MTLSRDVLTFGSALHPQTLGRHPTTASPAHVPNPIPSLGGIPIRKVVMGGWIGAAVSEDDDLYVWGGQAGESGRIGALPRPSDVEEIKLVTIDDGVDIVDVGVGSEHILALTKGGDVWATGDGISGQLGTGGKKFEVDWVKIGGEWEGKGKVVKLGCGVWSSWLIVDIRRHRPE